MRKAITIAFVVLSTAATAAAQRQPVDEVDITIGNVGILLEPTRPTAYLPNSMVRVYPVRKNALDDQVHYFPLTILSHRAPDLFAAMPGDGTPLTYDNEHATPYGYTSRLGDKNIGVEFAPAHQAGIILAAPNTSRDAKYVQSATWDGTPLTRLWLTHKTLTAGGTLNLTIQDVPNTTLGTKDADLPPASLRTDPTPLE